MKAFFKSKTIWFGILQIVLGTYGYLTNLMDSQTAIALIATGMGSISLRLSTSTPIKGF